MSVLESEAVTNKSGFPVGLSMAGMALKLKDLRHDKTWLRGFRPCRHKPGCTVTEDS